MRSQRAGQGEAKGKAKPKRKPRPKAEAKAKTNGEANDAKPLKIKLKPIDVERMRVTIQGISPYMQHAHGEKLRKWLTGKAEGRTTRDRGERQDPKAEFENAICRTSEGKYGIPLSGIKSSILTAAHKDIGIPRTTVQKGLFLINPGPGGIVAMDCDEPRMREDVVSEPPKSGKPALRYRPEYEKWEATFIVEFDRSLLRPEDVATLINRAGFGVGLGEWRPEKGGDLGRFQIKENVEA